MGRLAAEEGGCTGQTVLGIFDLRGFTSANADWGFVRFLVDIFFLYYPKVGAGGEGAGGGWGVGGGRMDGCGAVRGGAGRGRAGRGGAWRGGEERGGGGWGSATWLGCRG